MQYGEYFWVTRFGNTAYRHMPWNELVLCQFRVDPIPGSGRRGRYNYHRTPKTTQERRESLVYPEYTRSRRNKANLPCAWEDINRSDRGDKHSWKKIKKRKQWM